MTEYNGEIRLASGLFPSGDFSVAHAKDIFVEGKENKSLQEHLNALDQRFMGHNTNFTYAESAGLNPNDIKNEYHAFAFNGVGLPTAFGFLDAYYFDGSGFSPYGNGKTPVTKQVWTDWRGEGIYTRTYSDPHGWSTWRQITGNGTSVSHANNADNATVLKSNKWTGFGTITGTYSIGYHLANSTYIISWKYQGNIYTDLFTIADQSTGATITWKTNAQNDSHQLRIYSNEIRSHTFNGSTYVENTIHDVRIRLLEG